ncbi:F-box/kelch-repeat protein At2g43270-like [Aegilops tauschii subsp. strangulata]|uniref:F-box/kelch-repeat protein At2g43270-like n=1 Tax=Aegilops tauschii subsp. strangulata TaxID=200361 RepID=UPI001ABC90BA|nr:F-box/kelch-repeat protein At2g43270-like [Aegilops tauschii subsp. strangulata]
MMTSNGQKRNKAPTPELPDELVSEIMTRLPVKSLIRFKCVKAWRTTISDPSFVRSHLKISTSDASLLHASDFTGKFRLFLCFCHCNGLVLVSTDTKMYLINPATRGIVTLPESSHYLVPASIHRPIAFGRDLRTGMYKVVQFFFAWRDYKFYMGVEMCTVGDPATPAWREIAADRWYHAVSWVTAQSVNGGVYWIVDVDDTIPTAASSASAWTMRR